MSERKHIERPLNGTGEEEERRETKEKERKRGRKIVESERSLLAEPIPDFVFLNENLFSSSTIYSLSCLSPYNFSHPPPAAHALALLHWQRARVPISSSSSGPPSPRPTATGGDASVQKRMHILSLAYN